MPKVPITHTISVYHLVRTGDKEDYEATPSITGLPVSIFPAGSDIVALYPGEFSYQLYSLFVFPQKDIRNGDKLVAGSESWIVKGAPQQFNSPQVKFQQIVIEKVVGT